MRAPFSQLLTSHFLPVVLLIFAILTGAIWNFNVVFIGISLISNTLKHFSDLNILKRYFLAIFSFYFKNSLFTYQAHFWMGCLFFNTSFLSSFYILDINPVRCIGRKDSMGFSFTQLIGSIAIQKHFSFMKSHLSTGGLNSWANGILFRKSFPTPLSCRALPMFSSGSFSVSGLGLWSIWSKEIDTDVISLFYMWTFSFLSTVCWRCFLFSSLYFRIIVIYSMVIVTFIHVWPFYFVPFVCMSVFVSVPHWFCYYGFVIYFEICNDNLSSIVLVSFIKTKVFSY